MAERFVAVAETSELTLANAPNRLSPWAMVAILCVLYAFSMLDRMMPALLVGALRVDLQVSPLQFGLLIGTGFGVLYAMVGIPIAYVIDSGNRKRIVLAGVMLWSASTIGSAAVGSYGELVVARAGVAIGEAVLIPAAMSMIGDLFASQDRIRATSVFAATGQIMGSALFLVGAGALALAAAVAPVAGLAEWRMAFLIVGVPPLIVGLAWAWLAREPFRQPDRSPVAAATRSAALGYLSAHRALFAGMYLSVGLTGMIAFGLLAWLPALLQQSGLSPAQAGAAMGLAGLVPTIAGAALSPFLASLLQRRGVGSAPILIGSSMLGLAILALACTIGSESAAITIVGFACATFGFAGFFVSPMLAIQWIAPSRMRARLTALNQFSVSAIGIGLGPPVVALIASHIFGDEAALGRALTALAIGAGLPAILALFLARRGYARAYRESTADAHELRAPRSSLTA